MESCKIIDHLFLFFSQPFFQSEVRPTLDDIRTFLKCVKNMKLERVREEKKVARDRKGTGSPERNKEKK